MPTTFYRRMLNTRLANARVVIPCRGAGGGILSGVSVGAVSAGGAWSAAEVAVRWSPRLDGAPGGGAGGGSTAGGIEFDTPRLLTAASPAVRIGASELAGVGAIVLELTALESGGPTPTTMLLLEIAIQEEPGSVVRGGGGGGLTEPVDLDGGDA